ncbi:MAG: serine/threonine-protein kinase [Ignavibacteriales bacterium]|nr:serine/threonine-protein kinase [Ignavibacteriales bacterium]
MAGGDPAEAKSDPEQRIEISSRLRDGRKRERFTMIGKTISHYKILEKLGEGGMGVVYKAHDTKLKREVALKFLPRHLTLNETERARFMQEAQAAATLNHPNICTIHAIEEGDNEQFIVMELIDGVTLREKFAPGPLPVREAVAYAIQIGEALEEAHNKGIIHRDIKSDNIMVNAKNQIRVMDFGLAKLKGSLKLTKATSTAGTLGYMAPEQIQDGETDNRSDIFSFGVVLFEMLTGKLPFRGEHEAALMYSILNEEPELLQKHLPDPPPDLERVILRALEKDPEDRYQSVADLVSELRRMQKTTLRISRRLGAELTTPSHEHIQAPVSRKRTIALWIAAAILMIAAVAVIFLTLPSVDSARLNPNMAFRTLEIPFKELSAPSLSLDGNWIAFAAAYERRTWDIYFMNASGSEPRRITFGSFLQVFPQLVFPRPEISPDGSHIAFSSYSEKGSDVQVVSSLGGPSWKIARGYAPRWRPDGKRIGFVRTPGAEHPYTATVGVYEFWTVNPDGTEPRLEFSDHVQKRDAFGFSWSPDGKSIAWIRTFEGSYRELLIRRLTTGEERQITFDKKVVSDVNWTKSNHMIFSSNITGNTNLWMTTPSGGAPVQITRGTGPDVGASPSGDGRKLVYKQSQLASHIWRGRLDGSETRQVTYDERSVWVPSFSPDGKLIAYEMSEADPSRYVSHIYIIDHDGANRRQISRGQEIAGNARWSPDGTQIAYTSRHVTEPRDSLKVYVVEVVNPAQPKLLGHGVPFLWQDPQTLIVWRPTGSWRYHLSGSPAEQVHLDSTWAAPVAGGRLLFYDLRKGKQGIWIVHSTDAAKAEPRKILEPPPVVTIYSFPYSLAADRKSFLYVPEKGTVWRVSLPDGRHQPVRGKYDGVDRASFISLSHDGKEVVYLDRYTLTKLVMVEDVFQ